MRIGIGIGVPPVLQQAPASFVPTDVSNCVLWLRADLGITLNGSDVSAWADQSGQGNDVTQGTPANQPGYLATGWSNGLPAVDFGAEADNYGLSGAMSDPGESITAFAVFTQTDATGVRFIVGTGTAGGLIVSNSSSGGVGYFDGGYKVGGTVKTDEQIVTCVMDGSDGSSEVRQDGASVATPTYDQTMAWTEMRIGYLNFAGASHGGLVAEVLVYDRTLTASEVGDVEAYLLERYGV